MPKHALKLTTAHPVKITTRIHDKDNDCPGKGVPLGEVTVFWLVYEHEGGSPTIRSYGGPIELSD